MEIFDVIAERKLIWSLFAGYMALTYWLAWLGHKRTDDIESFAIGRGTMNPLVVGVTLAASIASTATFVINPGFVYVHGVSALIHLAGAVGLGLIVGLVTMSTGFRRLGAQHSALTLPQWIGNRYGSRRLSVVFAVVNLLSLSFVVLIVGGLSIVMQKTLGLSNTASLILMIIFVFSYVFIGGTYAHAYTNTLQGIIMVVVALIIVGSGLGHFADGFASVADKLRAVDPNLLESVNPASSLFGSFFSVYVSGFIIGFALVCQPHIMTKALYVENDRAVWTYLAVTGAVSVAFMSLLLVGLYAHLSEVPRAAFIDPSTGALRQDLVMTVYITKTFSPTTVAFITVALMAAGMSTLDGILVSLSSIAANDLYLNIAEKRWLAGKTRAEMSRSAHRASQAILVAIGVVAFLIALEPPKLLGIFGQVGVYGIVAASTVPILFGIVSRRLDARWALVSAAVGGAVHFVLYGLGRWATDSGIDLVASAEGLGPVAWILDTRAPQLGFLNPGVTATYGLIASALVAGAVVLVRRLRSGDGE